MNLQRKHLVLPFTLGIVLLLTQCSSDENFHKPNAEPQNTPALSLDHILSTPERQINVSIEQAITLSSGTSTPSTKSFSKKLTSSYHTFHTSTGEPALHVINHYPTGYTIVSASRKYTPIIAQSPNGHIPFDSELPPLIQEFITSYIEQIEYANTLPDSLTRQARLEWEMLGNTPPTQIRTVDYNPEVLAKISATATKYRNKGYKVYRYVELMGSYSYNNEYNPNNQESPSFTDSHIDDYILTSDLKKQIHQSVAMLANKKYSIDYHTLILLKKHTVSVEKPALLSTTWGQGRYIENTNSGTTPKSSNQYNSYVPNYHLLGCVSVATGQIMKYHQHPQTYQWNTMPSHYPSETTARFLYNVAKGVKTRFGKEGSSATMADAKSYLEEQRYKVNEIKHNIQQTLKIELSNNRPILANGNPSSKKNGHAFVIDGCIYKENQYEIKVLSLPDAPFQFVDDQEMSCIFSQNTFVGDSYLFHINMGWNGYYNGLYTFDNFYGYNNKRGYYSINPLK